jgi:DNA-binding response OmpR family regulator
MDATDSAGTHTKVLIIDDDPAITHMIASALIDAGYDVSDASDGETGLQKAKEIQPSLVICDYRLPDIDGLEVIGRLRKDSQGAALPIIMATNYYELELMNEAMELGVKDYILKADVNLEEIVRMVRALLAPAA